MPVAVPITPAICANIRQRCDGFEVSRFIRTIDSMKLPNEPSSCAKIGGYSMLKLRYGFAPVSSFAANFPPRFFFKQPSNTRANNIVIVGDYDPNSSHADGQDLPREFDCSHEDEWLSIAVLRVMSSFSVL
jgi:hypothetical protein